MGSIVAHVARGRKYSRPTERDVQDDVSGKNVATNVHKRGPSLLHSLTQRKTFELTILPPTQRATIHLTL